jgi:raffinose synthase
LSLKKKLQAKDDESNNAAGEKTRWRGTGAVCEAGGGRRGHGAVRERAGLPRAVAGPGVTGNQPAGHRDGLASCPCWAWAWCTRFCDELHSYLASCGVVEVDAQNVIETLGAGHGGRAVARGLRGDQLPRQRLRLVHAPQHGHALQRQADRASDDFYPRDPASHTTVHVSSVAYNTLCLGEFIVFVSFVDSF